MRRHDRNDEPIAAAKAYEEWLATGTAPLDAYLDLALLYFLANDGGYAAHHKLPASFLNIAWRRIPEVLDEAEHQHGPHPEIKFWRRYVRFILLGEDWMTAEDCMRLIESGETRTPYFYLFGSFAGLRPEEAEHYRPDVMSLLEEVSEGATARERYIRSVVHSAIGYQAGKT